MLVQRLANVPVACFNMTDLNWVHYVWPTLDQRMPATLVYDKSCGKYYVDPTLGQCSPATCFNMTVLRWAHYVGPKLDQRMPVNLVLDKSLLKILRWPNAGPIYTGGLFLKKWFGYILCWMHYVCLALDQRTRDTLFLDESLLKILHSRNVGPTLVKRMYEEKLAPNWKWQNVNVGTMLGRC